MGQPLEVHIRKLQEFYWSDGDPDGRGFVPLADALRRAGDLREAHRLLRDGLNRHPDYLSGHVVAAWLSLDQGRLGEAEEHFRTALELDSRNVAALRGLAEVLLDKGQPDEALPFLDTLFHEEPFDGDLPAKIRGLRAEVEGPQEDASPGPERVSPVWADSDGAAAELDWEVATLQRDASRPSPKEVPGDEEGSGPDAGPGEEKEGPLSVVEDGEPIPSPEDMEEALVTSTLGEIYLRQGLFDRAEKVFEQLLAADPENEHLRHRLEETRNLMDFREQTGSDWEVGAGKSVAAHADEEYAISVDFLAPEDTAGADVLPKTGEGGFEGPDPAWPSREVADPLIPVVPIESLIPDGVGTGREKYGSTPGLDPEEVVSVGDLAPLEAVSVDDLAPPEVVSVDDLAPEEVLSVEDLAPQGVVPVEDLAPEGVPAIESSGPEEVISVEALAPEPVVSVDDLAPATPSEGGSESNAERVDDGDSSDSTVDAFERWLENLQ